MLKKLIASTILGLVSLTGNASHLVHLEVHQQADIYNVYVEMEFDAPAERVRAILTDYANLDRLNTSIISSKIIDRERDGSVRVLTRFENCVLLFCMDLQKVEEITEDEQGRILVAIVPDSSSFRSGQASWEVRSTGAGSRVIHHAKLEPDLWLPPWIGVAILKDTLQREIQESFENLECLARVDCQPLPATISTGDIWEEVTQDI